MKYDLVPFFKDNFDPATENNAETVFDIQMVANDGTSTITNSNQGGKLNFPYNSPFRCCGFYQPSQDLMNSYRTDESTGLPYLSNYNAAPVKSDFGVGAGDSFTPYTGSLDPRADWTIGRRVFLTTIGEITQVHRGYGNKVTEVHMRLKRIFIGRQPKIYMLIKVHGLQERLLMCISSGLRMFCLWGQRRKHRPEI